MPKATPMTMKRINRELADLSKEDLGGMTLAPNDANLFEWKATIPGPQGSVYEGGLFHVDITLPDDYPFSAPKATFVTKIYHMNISERGQVCVDLLKNNWSPALSLFKVMLSLSSLLTDPNPRDPLVPGIATQYNRQRALHDSTARQWVQLYALPDQASTSTPGSSSSIVAAMATNGQRMARRATRMLSAMHHLGVANGNGVNGTSSALPHSHPHPLPHQHQHPQILTRTRSSRNHPTLSTLSTQTSHAPITISDDESPPTTNPVPMARKRKSDSSSTSTSNGGGEASNQIQNPGRQTQRRRLNGDSAVIVIDD